MGSLQNATRIGTQGAITLVSTPDKIVDLNRRRQDILIQNVSDQLVFIGLNDLVTVDGQEGGVIIPPGASMEIDGHIGPIWGLCESGTAEVRYLEFME